ncbi:MAG: transposase, partial [Janthinobacterium lividum]
MEQGSTSTEAADTMLFAEEAWFDPIEAGIRDRVRGFIEELIGQELEAALGCGRYERDAKTPKGYRNGTRERQLLGSFGSVELSVPRARMVAQGGGTQEWRSATL